MTLLCPLPGCRLVRVARDGPDALIIVAEGQHDHARCPACRTVSTAVHSRYRRRAADLPASGKAVRLHLVVRRFLCPYPACPRRTFAERFPAPARPVCPPHPPPQQGPGPDQSRARRSTRRPTAVASGYAGQCHNPVANGSGAAAAERGPAACRRDDWALRKGRTYATILVDLERRRPLDLLAGRSAETLAAWLRREPQIRLVARDRSPEYARGIAMGAPAAVQVADRWHLLLNTRQMIERWLTRA